MAEDLGGQRPALRLRDVGRVGEDRVELVGHVRKQVSAQPRDLQPEPLPVGARQRERVVAEIAARQEQVRALVLQRQRHGAAAGAHVEHARAVRERKPDFDEQLRLRARDQRARIDSQVEPAKAAVGEDVGDRLALHHATAHRVLEGPDGGPFDDQVAVDDQPLAGDAEHMRQQKLGIQTRGFAPGRRDRGDRPVERVARGGAPHAAPLTRCRPATYTLNVRSGATHTLEVRRGATHTLHARARCCSCASVTPPPAPPGPGASRRTAATRSARRARLRAPGRGCGR